MSSILICAFSPIEDKQTPSRNPLNINHPHTKPGVLTLNKPGRRDRGPTNRPIRSRRRYLALPLYAPLVVFVNFKHTNNTASSSQLHSRSISLRNSSKLDQQPSISSSHAIRSYIVKTAFNSLPSNQINPRDSRINIMYYISRN